jgi:hypothetical protein
MEKKYIPTPRMADVWEKAAADLKITFISPFTIEYNGKTIVCAGFLPDFGCPKGAIVLELYDSDEVYEACVKGGYFISKLNPFEYEKYSRELFIATLNDWGWFGDSKNIPQWYSGASWTP